MSQSLDDFGHFTNVEGANTFFLNEGTRRVEPVPSKKGSGSPIDKLMRKRTTPTYILIESLKNKLVSTSWKLDEKNDRARVKLTAVSTWLMNVACCANSEELHDSIAEIAESLELDEKVRDSVFKPRPPLDNEKSASDQNPDFMSPYESAGQGYLVQRSLGGSSAFFVNKGMAETFMSATEADAIYASSSADPDSVMRRLVATRDRLEYLQCMTELVLGSPDLLSEASLVCHIHTREAGPPTLCTLQLRASFSSDGEEVIFGAKIAPLPPVPLALRSDPHRVSHDEGVRCGEDSDGSDETETEGFPPRICGFKAKPLFLPPSVSMEFSASSNAFLDTSSMHFGKSPLGDGRCGTEPDGPPPRICGARDLPLSSPSTVAEGFSALPDASFTWTKTKAFLGDGRCGSEPNAPPPRICGARDLPLPSPSTVAEGFSALPDASFTWTKTKAFLGDGSCGTEPNGPPPRICGARDLPLPSPSSISKEWLAASEKFLESNSAVGTKLQLKHREILNTGFEGTGRSHTQLQLQHREILHTGFEWKSRSHTKLQLQHREILHTGFAGQGSGNPVGNIETEPEGLPPRVDAVRWNYDLHQRTPQTQSFEPGAFADLLEGFPELISRLTYGLKPNRQPITESKKRSHRRLFSDSCMLALTTPSLPILL